MSLLRHLAASVLLGGALVLPARAYDLQVRQNGTAWTPAQLRAVFDRALPAAYDQRFPAQRWSTYLLLDAHAGKSLVAITMGLSPRIGPERALLPVATFSVIEPLPRTPAQWQQLLAGVAGRYARLMLDNSGKILKQP